jgi:PAS domain S-box-containing protein
MDEKAFRSMLEDLPLAIFWFKGLILEWRNAFAYASLSGNDASDVQDRLKAVVKEYFSRGRSPIDKLEISRREFYVGVHRSRENGLIVLIPVGEDAVMFPEIGKTRQAALDFEDIFRNSFDGIFVTDGSGVTLMVNEGCERNYDVAAADLIGRHVSVFERKGWIRPVVAAQVARTGQRISTTQRTHTGKTIMVTGMPLFDSVGNVRKVVINSRDTTELLQLQEALALARENLRRVDQEIEALRLQNLKVEGVVLRNESMQRIASMAARVAKVDVTVLITGKSGVGKDVIAHLIHRESTRSGGPLTCRRWRNAKMT